MLLTILTHEVIVCLAVSILLSQSIIKEKNSNKSAFIYKLCLGVTLLLISVVYNVKRDLY